MKYLTYIFIAVSLLLLVGCGGGLASALPGKIPDTTVSAITSPPLSMEDINTHTEIYGTGADPNIITLGPKVGGPAWTRTTDLSLIRTVVDAPQ